MRPGDRIIISKKALKESYHNKVTWYTLDIPETECIFLGYTNVYDGEIIKEYIDYETGYRDPKTFVQTKTHKVMVVQPIYGDRYRKPIYSPVSNNFVNEDDLPSTKDTQKRFDEIKNVLGIE